MELYLSNLVHGVLNGVELELVYNFFISCSIAEISWAKVHYAKQSLLHKNLESAEFTNKKHGKPLYIPWQLIMCVFVKACSHDATCIIGFFCLIIAETKKMIYESVNVKGAVYKPKQNSFTSFSFQSITTCTGFASVGLIFVHQTLTWKAN